MLGEVRRLDVSEGWMHLQREMWGLFREVPDLGASQEQQSEVLGARGGGNFKAFHCKEPPVFVVCMAASSKGGGRIDPCVCLTSSQCRIGEFG